ncbi:hypothetical protein HDV04_003876 [Boothiomyces sp. JEL0838]|nr:hypothetical protein HDV04_003876 [Boothiomyces sp. JEL0838]
MTATDMAPSITDSPNGTYNPTVTGAKTPKTKSPKTKQTGMTPQQTYMPSQMPTKTPKVVSGGMRNEYLLSLSIMKFVSRLIHKSIRYYTSERQNFEVSQYINILTAEGFKKPEAEAIVTLISEVIDESLQASSKGLVLKKEQEKFMGESQSELKRLQTDIKLLEQKDFGLLKSNLDGIKFDVEKVKGNIRDDIKRVHAGVRLDMNLEKSRIQLEATELLEQLKLAEERIDQQVDKLEVRMAKIKNGTKNSVSKTASVE